MEALLAFSRPALDWHALAPELTLLAVGTLLTVVDIIWDDKSKQVMPTLAGVGSGFSPSPVRGVDAVRLACELSNGLPSNHPRPG